MSAAATRIGAAASGTVSHLGPQSARLASTALLSASAAATALWALSADRPQPLSLLVLACLSFGGLAAVLLSPPLRRAVSSSVVVLLTLATLAVAVVPQPPLGADMWLYAVYGRAIVEHGESPYVHPPADRPEDPWVRDLTLFRDTEALYGPAFLAMTAGVPAVGRESRLAVRLGYQVGAAIAVLGSLLVMARSRAHAATLALVGLNPVLIVEVVSQGRNDAYVGLALLVAVTVARRHPHLAAVAIAVGALVKLPAGLALVGLAAWVWRHFDRRQAVTVTATGAAVVGLAYLAAGGVDAVRPVLEARLDANDVSVWVFFRENGLARAAGSFQAALGPISDVQSLAPLAALSLTALVLVRHVGDRTPVAVVAFVIAAYFLTSPYFSSWYVAWVLPLLALLPRSTIARLVVVLSSVLFVRMHYIAALHVARGHDDFADLAIPVEDWLLQLLQVTSIALELAGIVFLVASTGAVLWRRWGRPVPAPVVAEQR